MAYSQDRVLRTLVGILICVSALVFAKAYFFPSFAFHLDPETALKGACQDWVCMNQVEEHLPDCRRGHGNRLTRTVSDGAVMKEVPYLSLDLLKDMADCIARAEGDDFDAKTLDLSRFQEVKREVRRKADGDLTSSCEEMSCSDVRALPVVGYTQALHGPA